MANKKSVADLKAHLAGFDPVYPLRKGCIARLFVKMRNPKVTALMPTTDFLFFRSVSAALVEPPSPTSSITRKKCVGDLKTHLACFGPVYPFKKGYIAQLLVETRAPSITALLRKVKTLNPTTSIEQDKCIDEVKLRTTMRALQKELNLKKNDLSGYWDSLVLLFQQPFPVYFKDLPNAVVLLQSHQISSPTQASDVSSVSVAIVGPTSPKKLRYDCDNCITKQRTLSNLRETIITLRRRLFDQKKYHAQELASFTSKKVKQTIRRKDESISIWRTRCKSAFLRCNRFMKVKNSLETLKEKRKSMKEKLQECESRNRNIEKQLQKILQKKLVQYKHQFGDELTKPYTTNPQELMLMRNSPLAISMDSEVQNTDKEYQIHLELLHFKPEEVKITSDNKQVTITAKHGSETKTNMVMCPGK